GDHRAGRTVARGDGGGAGRRDREPGPARAVQRRRGGAVRTAPRRRGPGRRARRGRRRTRRTHPGRGRAGREPAALPGRAPPEAAHRAGRNRAALRAVPVPAQPRGPGHQPHRRAPRRGAGLLMARTSRRAAGTLEQLLAAKEIVICCGSGGVGKTTTAAAAGAMAAARLGGKVLVVTVDPARRLANALGLESFGNVETRVPDAAFGDAGIECQGELWAAMLDTKQSWDDLVRQHAPDAATRDAILANPLYTNITGRFVQSHDYIAMERLYEIHA